MITAYAYILCDHPGCRSGIMFPEPLQYGQLNPIQVEELCDLARAAGWVGCLVGAGIQHFCGPDHAQAVMEPPPPPTEMAAALAERMKPENV